MSSYYFEIRSNEGSKVASILIAKVVSILHAVTKVDGQSPIGINFPFMQEHKNENVTSFGETMRVFGTKGDLLVFLRNASLSALLEEPDLTVSKIQEVPDDAAFVQTLRDRTVERRKKLKIKVERYFPYMKLKSLSNKKKFSLFIKTKTVQEPTPGYFSTYGLSKDGSTTPYF